MLLIGIVLLRLGCNSFSNEPCCFALVHLLFKRLRSGQTVTVLIATPAALTLNLNYFKKSGQPTFETQGKITASLIIKMIDQNSASGNVLFDPYCKSSCTPYLT